MSVMDVFPTLCSAAGVPTGVDTPLDGIDLWPALQRGQAVEHPPFVMGTKETACIRSPWKLIRPSGNAAPLLFNIVEDPGETKNLAAERPELVDELSKEIARYGAPARGGEKRGGQKGGDKKQGDPKRGGKKQGDTKEQEKPTRESISNRPAAGVAR